MGRKKGGRQQQQQQGKKKVKTTSASRKVNFAFAGSGTGNGTKAAIASGPAPKPSKPEGKLELSLSHEAALRSTISELWRTVETDEDVRERRRRQLAQSPSRLKEEVVSVYDEVMRLGFTKGQAEDSLTSCSRDWISRESVLDWLCINYPADELPRKLASGAFSVGSAGSVEVITKGAPESPPEDEAKAREDREREDRSRREEEARRLEEEARRRREAEQLEARRREEAARKKREEEAQNKDWIKRYMESAYDEEEEGESEGDEDFAMMMASNPGASDDKDGKWKMYADAREVERGRRARPEDPSEAAAEVAAELEVAKAEAAGAKAAGDRERQREAGKMIRDLKEELRDLGFDDESQLAVAVHGQGDGATGGRDPSTWACWSPWILGSLPGGRTTATPAMMGRSSGAPCSTRTPRTTTCPFRGWPRRTRRSPRSGSRGKARRG